MKRSFSGFTLIELIVSVTIIGLLSGLGLVSYNKFNRRQILNSSVRRFLDDLKSAQSRSESGEKPEECLDGSLLSYEIAISESPLKYTLSVYCSNLGSPLDLKTVDFPEVIEKTDGFSWVKFKSLRQGVEFDSGEETITFTAFGSSKIVVVGKAGEIYSYESED